MSEPLFNIDLRDFYRFQKWIKNNPKQFKTVTALVLNELAYQTRVNSIVILKQNFIVRNEQFLNHSLRFYKAKTNADFKDMQSSIGSIPKNNFSGWKEQEYGGATMHRVFTMAARDSNPGNEIPKELRLKKHNLTDKQFPGRKPITRTIAMIEALQTVGSEQPFKIAKGAHRKLKPGLYQFKKRKLLRLQSFEGETKPKQIYWMTKARDKTLHNNNIRQLYADKLTYLLNKNKK